MAAALLNNIIIVACARAYRGQGAAEPLRGRPHIIMSSHIILSTLLKCLTVGQGYGEDSARISARGGLSKGQAGYVEWALGLPASGIKEILTYRIEKTRFECNKSS